MIYTVETISPPDRQVRIEADDVQLVFESGISDSDDSDEFTILAKPVVYRFTTADSITVAFVPFDQVKLITSIEG